MRRWTIMATSGSTDGGQIKMNKEFLKALDDVIAPNGKVDKKAFMFFFDAWCEDLSLFNRAVLEDVEDIDEDDLAAFDDSTMKHQVFSYGADGRTTSPWNENNDLPYLLANMASEDEEFEKEIRESIEDWKKQRSADVAKLLAATPIGNHNSDSKLLDALDAVIRDESHSMDDRTAAVRKLDAVMGEEKDSYTEQDVNDYLKAVKEASSSVAEPGEKDFSRLKPDTEVVLDSSTEDERVGSAVVTSDDGKTFYLRTDKFDKNFNSATELVAWLKKGNWKITGYGRRQG
jgi:hypothetical protein